MNVLETIMVSNRSVPLCNSDHPRKGKPGEKISRQIKLTESLKISERS